MIPDEQIQEVRERADIVEVVGEFVELKKAGKDYKGLCPFHNEKTPSFFVVPAKQMYHCFGCGKSGDAIAFMEEKHGMDFVTAVKHVGGRSGVTITEVERGRQEEDPLRPYYEACTFAADWFQKQLADEKVGAPGRAYLEKRGIDLETATRYGLGFAPNDWHALHEAAAKLGISEEALEGSKLLKRSEKQPGGYDVFRNRIIFPIHDERKRVIAFGGRIIVETKEKGNPKYLNSPNSVIYTKGDHLYGLGLVKHEIRREKSLLLMEGNMDVVAVAAAGYRTAVASMGTAFTDAQARLVEKFAETAYLLFDSDFAGRKAAFEIADKLLGQSVVPLVVTLPPGEDPDSIVKEGGREALEEFLKDGMDVLDLKIQMMRTRGYFDSLRGQREARDKLLPTLASVRDPFMVDRYIRNAAEALDVGREVIEHDIAQWHADREKALRRAPPPNPAVAATTPTSPGPPPPGNVPTRRAGPEMGPEHSILLVLARDRNRRQDLLEMALERVGPEDFKDPANRAIFQSFMDDPELDVPPDGLDEFSSQRLERLLAEPPDEAQLAHAEREFNAAVKALEVVRLGELLDQNQRDIAAAETAEDKLSLMREKQRLIEERNALGEARGGGFARRLARGNHTNDRRSP